MYPRVAQIKGESKWKDHDDLYWGKKTLSGERKKTARNKGQSVCHILQLFGTIIDASP